LTKPRGGISLNAEREAHPSRYVDVSNGDIKPIDLVAKRGNSRLPITLIPSTRAAIAAEKNGPAETDLVIGLNYNLYEGAFTQLPDFSKIKPVQSGVAQRLDLDSMRDGREDGFAIVAEGYLKVDTRALYRLTITSDDGSRVFVHGNLAIDHDGNHPANPASKRVRLSAGLHPIRIEYFQGLGEQYLEFKV